MFDLTMVQLGLDKKSDSGISPIYKGHFLIAEELFKSNKFIGVGPKNYRQHCYNNEKYTSQIIVETILIIFMFNY